MTVHWLIAAILADRHPGHAFRLGHTGPVD
jgi:hypothetical protein